MDELQKPLTPQNATVEHIKKHKKKYVASGVVAVLLACALELLPSLQELAKLKIQHAISQLQEASDAGR